MIIGNCCHPASLILESVISKSCQRFLVVMPIDTRLAKS